MYEAHFGLERRPFAVTADAPSPYPATGQEHAYRQLRHAVQSQEAFAILTGEAGTGKSMLALRLLHEFQSTRLTIWIASTQLADRASLLQAMLYDLGEPYLEMSEQELRLQLTDCILKAYGQGKPTLLLIDEAHHLTSWLLEELRLLTNLETRQGKAVQAVLAGQPMLEDVLRLPELASLSQRATTRCRLAGMDVHEAVDYLLHHLRAAGGKPEQIATEEALETLARSTGGVPGLLNLATHRALQLAHAAEQPTVDVEAVIEALGELGLSCELETCEEQTLLPLDQSGLQKEVLEMEAAQVASPSTQEERIRRVLGMPRRPA